MFRSLLFVPGNSVRFIDKAKTIKADIICLDLEDSVPLHEKEMARKLVGKSIEKRDDFISSSIFVRTNSVQSMMAFTDIESTANNGLDGIVVPKVNDSKEVHEIEEKLTNLENDRKITKNSIKIIPSIETAIGVVNTFDIANASVRNCAVVFGVFDFLHDMGLDYEDVNQDSQINSNRDDFNSSLGYHYARSKIPVDARAAGVEAIDAIWQNLEDNKGLEKDTVTAKRLGYSGKSIIHPKQIELVHKVFRPTKNQIIWAKKVVEALKEPMEDGRGKGAVRLDGKMIDAVHYKQARVILKTADMEGKNE